MAATAEIITKPVASAISLRWIISARDDAIWFIGSVVSSYVLLILYVSGIVPLVPMVAAWAILIDAPHGMVTVDDELRRADCREAQGAREILLTLGGFLHREAVAPAELVPVVDVEGERQHAGLFGEPLDERFGGWAGAAAFRRVELDDRRARRGCEGIDREE